jgi:hypothetical protein
MVAVGALITMSVGSAHANGLNLGTETYLFADGSTMTGFFTLTPGTTTVTGWNFQYSGGTSGFGAATLSSADAANAPTSLVVSNFNGDEVLTFEENEPDHTRWEFDIVVACGGATNCLSNATTGMSFAVTSGPEPCPPPGTAGFCIQSGLQRVPEGFGQAPLAANANFLNVTDPPNSLAFNVSKSADFPLFTPGGGGPGPTNAPEPGTLPLLATGLAALIGLTMWKKGTLAGSAS